MKPKSIKGDLREKQPATGVALRPPSPARQVRFYQLLVGARKQWFIDALSATLREVDQNRVQRQVAEYVPADVRQLLAAAGLRDEHLFPLPAILESRPSLVGYYRLLLGAPQKTFYKGSTGMGRFKRMEEQNVISKQGPYLREFCRSMSQSLAELVRQIPKMTERDLHELPVLTFGSQLQGSNNTLIGRTAMKEVFAAVKDIMGANVVDAKENRLKIRNAAGRIVSIALAHDPDLAVTESIGEEIHSRVAIEVKGGTDVSNAHNRAGEAEKSHQKARRKGFPELWTIISKQGIDPSKLRAESPTTNHWFDVSEILARAGADWEDFRHRLAVATGIPLR